MDGEVTASGHAKHVSEMRAAAELAETACVGWRLARLREGLSGPLVVVGVGGTHGAAMLWARAHEAAGHPAWAATPYDFVERPLPSGTNALLLSMSGRHHDMLAAALSARDRAERVFAVVADGRAPMCTVLRDREEDDVLVFPRPPQTQCVVEQWGAIGMAALIARVYGITGPLRDYFEQQPVILAPEKPGHVYCLGAGYGRVAAEDLARLIQESDIARASAHDVRDFAHGSFFPASREGAVAITAAHGEQREYAAQVRAILRSQMTTYAIESDDGGLAGGVSLFAKTRITHAVWAESVGALPVRADIPEWAVKLYHLPFSRTD